MIVFKTIENTSNISESYMIKADGRRLERMLAVMNSNYF
jgi:hypothetical protein